MNISLNAKELIGLARLTVEQAEKFCIHPNYKLRGSLIVIIDNRKIIQYDQANPRFGMLIDITAKNNGTVTFTQEGERKKVLLEDSILIVLKEDKVKYAIFND